MRNRPGHGRIGMVVIGAGMLLWPGCGEAPSKPEFHSDESGNFRVLLAGKIESSKQTLSSPAGSIEMTAMTSVDGDRVRRVVSYADLPIKGEPSSDPAPCSTAASRGWAAMIVGP